MLESLTSSLTLVLSEKFEVFCKLIVLVLINDSKSFFIILPLGPVPNTLDISIFFKLAILFAKGEIKIFLSVLIILISLLTEIFLSIIILGSVSVLF